MVWNTILYFQADEIIVEQGDVKPEMYKIISGQVAVYLHYGLPEEYLVGILSAQRCFNELSVLCDRPSTYTVVAFSQVLVLRISKDGFEDFIKNNTQNAIVIMKNLANTVDTLSLNLNMLNEDLTIISNTQNNNKKMQDITYRIRQYAAADSINKALFSRLV